MGGDNLSSLCWLLLFRHGAVGTAPCHPRASPSWRGTRPLLSASACSQSGTAFPRLPPCGPGSSRSVRAEPASLPCSSSCPRFPLCPALQGLVGSCTPSRGCRHEPVVRELFQRLEPSPNHRDGSRGWILHPKAQGCGHTPVARGCFPLPAWLQHAASHGSASAGSSASSCSQPPLVPAAAAGKGGLP